MKTYTNQEMEEKKIREAELSAKYADKRKCKNLFFENEKKGAIVFYNSEGLGIGFAEGTSIYNTSFSVGGVSYKKEEGNRILYGRSKILPVVGFVTEDGYVYYARDGIASIYSKGQIKNKKKAEEIKIGRVEVVGSGNDSIGVAYDLNNVKVGEVRNAGESTLLYGGGMLALVINFDEKNAPYSQSFVGFLIPAPPSASPASEGKAAAGTEKPLSGLNKAFKFFKK